MIKYGMCTKALEDTKLIIGSIYILDDFDDDVYLVREGSCDGIPKECITLISKEGYELKRKILNELIDNKDYFSRDTQEYLEDIHGLRNKFEEDKVEYKEIKIPLDSRLDNEIKMTIFDLYKNKANTNIMGEEMFIVEASLNGDEIVLKCEKVKEE